MIKFASSVMVLAGFWRIIRDYLDAGRLQNGLSRDLLIILVLVTNVRTLPVILFMLRRYLVMNCILRDAAKCRQGSSRGLPMCHPLQCLICICSICSSCSF